MTVSSTRVHNFLNPSALAIVGASENSSWAQGFMKNLRAWGGFDGEIFMVNPNRTEVFERHCYPRVTALPTKVDHAVILVRSDLVFDILQDCADAGIRSATVVASGFEGGGLSSRKESERVRQLCEDNEIALLGPNCYGFNNYAAGTFLSRYSIDIPRLAGNVGVTVQSGQVGAAIADSAAAKGIKLRYLLSTGNELVLDTNDVFDFFVDDPEIHAIAAFLERIPDPERFTRIAQRAIAAGKPIVLLVAGKSEAASRIAVAHTGAITGSSAIVDAYLDEHKIIRVDSPEELIETAGLLSEKGWPKGGRTFYCGFSGGAAELFAEECVGTSLSLPQPDAELKNQLAEVSNLHPDVIHNPLDMTFDGAKNYAKIVDILARQNAYDIIVSQGQPKRAHIPDVRTNIRVPREEAFGEAAAAYAAYGVLHETGDSQPGVEVFDHQPAADAHYLFGRNGISALSNAAEFGSWIAEAKQPRTPQESGKAVQARSLTEGLSGVLDEGTTKKLFDLYDIPFAREESCTTAEEAINAAGRIGYPVVLKVASTDIPHKTEAGGVVLNLNTPGEVAQAFNQIMQSVSTVSPKARIDGMTVSSFVVRGREFFAGVVSDPRLGPAVVAGLGGVEIELLRDSALALAPLDRAIAITMLESLRSYPVLTGYRGSEPLDIESYIELLTRLGQLAFDLRGRIAEIDINPVFVRPQDNGVIAADALVIATSAAEEPQTSRNRRSQPVS